MAPKRSPPLDDLHSSSSDDEREEEDPVQIKSSVQKPQSPPESESNEGSDSDSDSDEIQNSPTASDFTVKPIASKPMENPSKPKKPTSKSNQLKPSAKRPAEGEKYAKDSRRKKSKVSNGDEEDGPIEEKKSAINRLWSEDDEIEILEGMIDYQSKKGADPYSDMVAFLEFIKDSLHVDVSKNQLTDKIRRLKKKYKNNVEKGENGEDPVFSRPHEHKSFELSKKIWGGGSIISGVDDNNVKSSKRKDKKSGNVMEDDAKETVLQEAVKEEIKEEEIKDFWSMYPLLSESLESEESIYLSLPKVGKNFVKERISLFGREMVNQLEEKWKDLRLMELKLRAKRIELVHEQTQLVLDGMKPSKS